MKYLVILTSLLLCACAHNSQESVAAYTEAQQNAIQYAREIFEGQLTEISDISVSHADSVLTDIAASTMINHYYISKYDQHASRAELDKMIDDIAQYIYDSQQCAKFHEVVNDSLGRLEKYDLRWRYIYTVDFTMKSGKKYSTTVVMEHDGITPRYTIEDHIQSLGDQEEAYRKLIEDFYSDF